MWRCSLLTEQFSIIERLAVTFQRDPLTFCWLDLASLSALEQSKWREQFGRSASPGSSAALRIVLLCSYACHRQTRSVAVVLALAFVVACSAKGQKIAMYPPDGAVSADALQQWLTRLLGGEVPQQATVPGLFV